MASTPTASQVTYVHMGANVRCNSNNLQMGYTEWGIAHNLTRRPFDRADKAKETIPINSALTPEQCDIRIALRVVSN